MAANVTYRNNLVSDSKGSRPVKQMAAPKAVTSRVRAVSTFRRADKSSPASTLNFMERLPSEILSKILSYLNASALFSISHVNKLFNQLANDNALWNKIYVAELAKNKRWKPNRIDEMRDRDEGNWKWLHFKTVAECDMDYGLRRLGLISHYTGLPFQTENVLRSINVTWELTVSDKSGRKATYEPSWSEFCETSVTLCWTGGGCLPNYQQISTLQLHGVRRVALDCPDLKAPGFRSLMAKLDVQDLTKSAQVIGQDKLVALKLLQPGVIIGIWRDQCSVAFVMFTLHFHRLVERSILGSAVCPYVMPIIKPPLMTLILNTVSMVTNYTLFYTAQYAISCPKAFPSSSAREISDGLIQLTAISRTISSRHTPLSCSITLPWRCEALQGTVENCCTMSLTLLDEFKKPFWCVTSPVSMELEKTPVSYDYDGEHYLIHYKDSDGQMKMKCVWMKEQEQFVLTCLVVYVTVSKVNKHFSREY